MEKVMVPIDKDGGIDVVDVKVKGCAHIQRDGEGE